MLLPFPFPLRGLQGTQALSITGPILSPLVQLFLVIWFPSVTT